MLKLICIYKCRVGDTSLCLSHMCAFAYILMYVGFKIIQQNTSFFNWLFSKFASFF